MPAATRARRRPETAVVRELYRARAVNFDRIVALYRLLGVRIDHYRRHAIDALELAPGMRVADLGCGTGLAFDRLHRAVGPGGEVLGVDLTDRMLERARRRVRRRTWRNVSLIEADLGDWAPPAALDGALAVFSLGLVTDFERTIERVAGALLPGGRLAVVELSEPPAVPRLLVELGVRLNRRFGVERELLRLPIRETVGRWLSEVEYSTRFWGGVQLVVGERR